MDVNLPPLFLDTVRAEAVLETIAAEALQASPRATTAEDAALRALEAARFAAGMGGVWVEEHAAPAAEPAHASPQALLLTYLGLARQVESGPSEATRALAAARLVEVRALVDAWSKRAKAG